jgi:hypothetical protein
MQLLKSMSVLSLTTVVAAAIWTIWKLPNSSRADQNAASETLKDRLEAVLKAKPEPELFGIQSSDYALGFAAFFESEAKLELYITDKYGTNTVVHEIRYELAKSAPPRGEPSESKEDKSQQLPHSLSLLGSYHLLTADHKANELKFSWNYSQAPSGLALTLLAGSSVSFLAGTGPAEGVAPGQQGTTATAAETAKAEAIKDPLPFPWPTLAAADSNPNPVVFDPFSARFVAKKDPIFKVKNRLPVELKPLSKADATKFVTELSAQAAPLDLLTPASLRSSDAGQLVSASQKCIESTGKFGERMLRSLPNVPYLLHRKANLLQSLCRGTLAFGEVLQDRTKQQQTNQEEIAANLNRIMATKVRNVFKSQNQELPRSIVSSPNWTIIFDDQKQHLWINALREIVEQSIAEINDTVVFEEERKVPVKMQVILRGRTMGTVVKGLIKNKKLEISSHVVTAPDAAMLNDSWTEIPKGNLASAAAGRTPMLNGQALINNESLWNALSDLCRASNGQVAIDLGDSTQQAAQDQPNKPMQYAGVWDESTRLETLDLFLRRGMAAKACKDFTVRVTPNLSTKAQDLVASFESEVIQAKQEIQLTNSRYRYLNLVPGTYEIYVNSLISGKMLERFDFTVAKDKRNQNISLTVGKDGDVLPETPAETD